MEWVARQSEIFEAIVQLFYKSNLLGPRLLLPIQRPTYPFICSYRDILASDLASTAAGGTCDLLLNYSDVPNLGDNCLLGCFILRFMVSGRFQRLDECKSSLKVAESSSAPYTSFTIISTDVSTCLELPFRSLRNSAPPYQHIASFSPRIPYNSSRIISLSGIYNQRRPRLLYL